MGRSERLEAAVRIAVGGPGGDGHKDGVSLAHITGGCAGREKGKQEWRKEPWWVASDRGRGGRSDKQD